MTSYLIIKLAALPTLITLTALLVISYDLSLRSTYVSQYLQKRLPIQTIAMNSSQTGLSIQEPVMSSTPSSPPPSVKLPAYNMSRQVARWFRGHLDPPWTRDAAFTLQPRGVCRPTTEVDLLIVVKSAVGNAVRRKVIRETYGKRGVVPGLEQRLVFLLGYQDDQQHDDATGYPGNASHYNDNATGIHYNASGYHEVVTGDQSNNAHGHHSNNGLRTELALHNDIVQGPFLDTYNNLTLKGVMGLRWVALNCPQAKAVLNIDDDVFVNIFRVAKFLLPLLTEDRYTIACPRARKNTKPIFRNATVRKWVVPEEYFRGYDRYPFVMCPGYFALLSGNMIRPMLGAVSVNPFFWIDDVYLYGLLVLTVGHVEFEQVLHNVTYDFFKTKECLKQFGMGCELFILFDHFKGDNADLRKYELWSLLVASDGGAETTSSKA